MVSVIVIVAIVGGVGWMVWGRRGRWRPATASGTPAGIGPRAPGVRGLYPRQYVSRRREVCRGDRRLSSIAGARSEAAPCRRAPGRSGPAATRRKRVVTRQRSILSRASEPRGSHRLMGLGLAWRSMRASVVPGEKPSSGAAGARWVVF